MQPKVKIKGCNDILNVLQPQVFPKNYVVSHYFNDSALCNEPVRMTVLSFQRQF